MPIIQPESDVFSVFLALNMAAISRASPMVRLSMLMVIRYSLLISRKLLNYLVLHVRQSAVLVASPEAEIEDTETECQQYQVNHVILQRGD
jgi:hypothetical protein